MRVIFCAFFTALATTAALADEMSVRQLLAKYDAIRPDDDQLAMYRLDWETSLATAQQRPRSDNRPVCLVCLHARSCDIIPGHC